MFVDLEFKGTSIGAKKGGNIEGWDTFKAKIRRFKSCPAAPKHLSLVPEHPLQVQELLFVKWVLERSDPAPEHSLCAITYVISYK